MRNRVILVTGASRGIGRAIATAFAARGCRVALAARGAEDLEAARKQIHGSAAFAVDLSNPDEAVQLVRSVENELGSIDILVNNAGQGSGDSPRAVADFDDAFWDRSIAVNLTSPYRLSKAVLPGMPSRKWGRILNIGSIMSHMAGVKMAAYVASKHGLLGLTRALALEVAPHGVTVNCICPGSTRTEMSDKRLRYNAQEAGKSFEEMTRNLTPMGRGGSFHTP